MAAKYNLTETAGSRELRSIDPGAPQDIAKTCAETAQRFFTSTDFEARQIMKR